MTSEHEEGTNENTQERRAAIAQALAEQRDDKVLEGEMKDGLFSPIIISIK